MATVKKTVSIPESLYKKALECVEKEHFPSFSDLVQHLIREHIKKQPELLKDLKAVKDDISAQLQIEQDPNAKRALRRALDSFDDGPSGFALNETAPISSDDDDISPEDKN